MTLLTVPTHVLEWRMGRSFPAGIARQASKEPPASVAGTLACVLLFFAHTTLRGSRSRGFPDLRKSVLL